LSNILLLTLLLASFSLAAAPLPRSDLWVANGTVYATALDEGNSSSKTLYIGGNFDYVGPRTGTGVAINATTATLVANMPEINGPVYAVVSDGSGGWFVGGLFTTVGGLARSNLVHIDNTPAVTSWNPGPDGAVRSLARSGTDLIVGGDFTSPRAFLASIDTGTAAVDGAFPQSNGRINALAADGAGGWFVGGSFSTLAASSRNNLAQIDNALAVTGWNPNPNGVVRTLALSNAGTALLAGGDFNTPRTFLASLDTTTAVANVSFPQTDAPVHSVVSDGSNGWYVGGAFTTVAAASRNNLARIDNSPAVTAWDPSPNNVVRGLFSDGTNLYAAGDFTIINALLRSRIASFALAGETLNVWAPVAGGTVNAISVFDPGSPDPIVVYAGGDFSSVGGLRRSNIAALDLITGAAKSNWDPSANATVRALLLSADAQKVYVGGEFTSIGGQFRNRLAAVDGTTGGVSTWDPNADNTVRALVMSDDDVHLFAGGDFTTIGAVSRRGAAEITIVNGLASTWDSGGVDGNIEAMLVSGGFVFLGGNFSGFGGGVTLRNNLAAAAADSGAIAGWNPDVNNTVRSMAMSADALTLYVGGDFTAIGSADPLNYIGSVDVATGVAGLWAPNSNQSVKAISLSKDRVSAYLGGDFTLLGAVSRNRLAAVKLSDGTVIDGSGGGSDWQPNADQSIESLAMTSDGLLLYAGGSFKSIASIRQSYIAEVATITLETQTPQTTASPVGTTFNNEDIVPITLLCDDGTGSGCAATYYTTDGTVPNKNSILYTGPFQLETTTVLRFFSVDNIGNTENFSANSESYTVELEAPVTTISPGTRIYESNSLTLTLTCSDDSSGCAATYYTLDDSTPTTSSFLYSGPFEISGNVIIKFFSIDNAGSVEDVKRASFISNDGGPGSLAVYSLFILAWVACLSLFRPVKPGGVVLS